LLSVGGEGHRWGGLGRHAPAGYCRDRVEILRFTELSEKVRTTAAVIICVAGGQTDQGILIAEIDPLGTALDGLRQVCGGLVPVTQLGVDPPPSFPHERMIHPQSDGP
jgi:hypothetical protein